MKAVTLNLHDEQAAKLDRAARALGTSQSALARDLFGEMDLAAVGRRRLRELEALAAAGIAKANEPSPGTAAGEQHLAEHHRLAGITSNIEDKGMSEDSKPNSDHPQPKNEPVPDKWGGPARTTLGTTGGYPGSRSEPTPRKTFGENPEKPT